MIHARSPDKNDKDIGKRIRARRAEMQISQADLGDAIGVSFQQIQKYEKGVNRVGATRLDAIARKLGVPMIQLMHGPNGVDAAVATPGLDFLTSTDGARIARAWPNVTDAMRRVISNMVVGTAGTQMQAAE